MKHKAYHLGHLWLVAFVVVLLLFLAPLALAQTAQPRGDRDVEGEPVTKASAAVLGNGNNLYLPIIFGSPVLENGGFESGDLRLWSSGGAMASAVVTKLDSDGNSGSQTLPPLAGQFSALLGDPNYDNLGGVPVGYAELRRQVTLPDGAPQLKLTYRIFTHDRIYSLGASEERYFDTFELYIDSTSVSSGRRDHRCRNQRGVPATDGTNLVLCDGNPDLATEVNPPRDMQTQSVTIDLSDRAGETVTVIIRVINRLDGFFNTWAYLDAFAVVQK